MRPNVNMPEEDRATDRQHAQKNFVKISRVFPEIPRRQTDRQTHSSRGEVMRLITDIFNAQEIKNDYTSK